MSTYKDELVDTSNGYFEQVKEHVSPFFPNMDLSDIDLLKVVRGGKLMDKEDKVPHGMITTFKEAIIPTKKEDTHVK